jgi:hypothetical protein
MAYDEELADRIRWLIGHDPALTERKMFGGLAFLIRGNMALAASSEGRRHGPRRPAQSDSLLATTNAMLVNMRGRDMPGWLHISSDELRTDEQLAPGSRSAQDTHAHCPPNKSPPEHCALQPPRPASLIILRPRRV